MAYKPQISFAGGEVDPALQERTTLERYDSGLAKGRGVYISKTGRIISLPGTIYSTPRKYNDRKCKTYYPENSDYEIEVGHESSRVHNLLTNTFEEFVVPSHPLDLDYYQEEDLDRLHISSDRDHIYFFHPKYISKKMKLGALSAGGDPDKVNRFNDVVWDRVPPTFTSVTANGTPAGYDVEYVATLIINGIETIGNAFPTIQTGKLPIAANQNNVFSSDAQPRNDYVEVTEMKVYRRPKGGNAWGYVGSSKEYTVENTPVYKWIFKFTDIGGAADYTHRPPDYIPEFREDIEVVTTQPNPTPPPATITTVGINTRFPTGMIYQQRLVVSGVKDKEAVFTSRVKYKASFLADSYLNSASALAMKSGTTGRAHVLRMLDAGPMVAFTTAGVYANNGNLGLDFNNIGMTRRGNWVIDENVPPLIIPGGFLFVEKSTGAVISFNYSEEMNSFTGGEITIYSDHLFRGKRVKSWAYQSGLNSLIWVVMDDGTINILNYMPEQKMMAWTWGDTLDGQYETVGVHKTIQGFQDVYFTVNRNGFRYREKLAQRFNVNFYDYIGCHSSKVFKSVVGTVTIVPTGDPEVFYLDASSAIFANTAGNGQTGTKFRLILSDGSFVNFTVTDFVNTAQVEVSNDDETEILNSTLEGATVYRPQKTLTGLDHLEGLSVYIKSDGSIVASPLNVDDNGDLNYDEYFVVGGQIILEESAAIVIVGVPQVHDIQTLDPASVEQSPTTLESITLNKFYIKYFNSRGVFTNYEFPEDNTIQGMTDTEYREEDDETEFVAEAPILPYTKRVEVVDAGSWQSHGKVSMRHVDGHPVEILSIIPDFQVERK